MKITGLQLLYEVYESASELEQGDYALLQNARLAASDAYAPYSKFKVGAAAMLANGKTVKGANQENASFPAGICAERVLLSAVSSQFPGVSIETIAITYETADHASDHPIAPCGICRQTLQEYEKRLQHPIRLILGGNTGCIFIIPKSSQLLPLAFTADELDRHVPNSALK